MSGTCESLYDFIWSSVVFCSCFCCCSLSLLLLIANLLRGACLHILNFGLPQVAIPICLYGVLMSCLQVTAYNSWGSFKKHLSKCRSTTWSSSQLRQAVGPYRSISSTQADNGLPPSQAEQGLSPLLLLRSFNWRLWGTEFGWLSYAKQVLGITSLWTLISKMEMLKDKKIFRSDSQHVDPDVDEYWQKEGTQCIVNSWNTG